MKHSDGMHARDPGRADSHEDDQEPGPVPRWKGLTTLFNLVPRNTNSMSTVPIRHGKAALRRFAIEVGDRISVN